MTLAEMRTELWETAGEETNLDPSTTTGAERLNRWINQAYKTILFWRFPDGTQMRFPCTEGLLYFKTTVVTGSITGAGTQDVTLDSAAGAGDNQYAGWIVDVGGVKRLVMASDTSRVCTVHDAWPTTPTVGDTYTLYKNFMRLCESGDIGANENIVLSPRTQVMAIRKITDIKRFWNLAPMERTETNPVLALTAAWPRSYMRRQNDIVFDYAAVEEIYYRMEYARMPPDLVSDDDAFETPSYFDDAILLRALWRVLVWQQDNDEAYARKRDLDELMTRLKQQGEMEYERESGGAEVQL